MQTPVDQFLQTTPQHLKKLKQLGIDNLSQFIEFFPRKVESTNIIEHAQDIKIGQKLTLGGQIYHLRREKTRHGKQLTKARLLLRDDSEVEVIWFRAPYQLRTLSEGQKLFLVGKIDLKFSQLQIQNPEIHLSNNIHVGGLRPIYPESPPLTSKWWREKMSGALKLCTNLPDPLPQKLLADEKLFSKAQAVRQIHFPDNLENWEKAKQRLGFEEIFGIQLRVMRAKILREKLHQNPHQFTFDPEVIKLDLQNLPFELTTAQKKVLLQILQDFDKERPSNRMIQGDVGSGKTIVAFLSALQIARQGWQVAIMAPTEILAKQHFANALKFFPSELGIELLTGSTTAKEKTRIKNSLKTNQIKIILGTHALITETTIFADLGLAIIDEQHRFGVQQRALLAGQNAHLLNMTATPIPRSLALTIYGDQDISIIDEKPAGRRDIITRIVADPKTQSLCYRFLEDQVHKGFQVFWVCPLVEESESLAAKSVLAEYKRISNEVFPKLRVEYLHGKMKPKEKDDIMRRFKAHEFDILVSTSVIEVGVDIPNATVMVIENSERFGLSQLHQFRGRIGRNDQQCYCFLMVGEAEDKHRERLKAMEKSNDGFYLSEVDLRLRGAGEVYGRRQSGLPDLKMADLSDTQTMSIARQWAEQILTEDFNLDQNPQLREFLKESVMFG